MSALNFNIPFNPFTPKAHNFCNLTGRRFGRLFVISIYAQTSSQLILWLCRCDCGNWSIPSSRNLRSTNTTSCGCFGLEQSQKRRITHGFSVGKKSAEFNVFHLALKRCTNPKDKRYNRYGGRGIEFRIASVADMVAEIGLRPSARLTLDRIDNNGHYETGNIRWATRQKQARNRSTNHVITINGESRCIAEWAEIFQIKPQTIQSRLHYGWSPQDAVTVPVGTRPCHANSMVGPGVNTIAVAE